MWWASKQADFCVFPKTFFIFVEAAQNPPQVVGIQNGQK